MDVFDDNFVATINDFKNRLHRRKELIRDFAIAHRWKVATFRAAISRDSTMKPEMLQAILDYIEADKKEQEGKKSKEV